MAIKHRRKSAKKLGHNDHSGLRRRGSGNRGGVGKAGHGKRMKQKKHSFIIDGKVDYGKHGFTSIHKKIESISIGMISEIAEKSASKKFEYDAKKKKVLGSGQAKKPIIIKNYSKITQKAKDKVIKAGGEVKE
ncbi:MAG: uL15 family ribosomal protein [Candidatus Nanoarchaeia archaeon]|nr:uL15 family ribosomal protein [Candidatus Nanoarchaeia archaeon]MDD5054004.1 uL15 family ribosomal protein [Candidatus Nanoarchaeia archaeon]MDD5499999.1 uL15 family ribosomal protein [Candidatus Nanoarchaeia archaeon]